MTFVVAVWALRLVQQGKVSLFCFVLNASHYLTKQTGLWFYDGFITKSEIHLRFPAARLSGKFASEEIV